MSRNASAYVAISAAILIWSHAFVAIKYCLRSVTPWELVILRHVPAALVFGAYWVMYRRGDQFVRMVRADGWKFVVAGFVAVTAYHWPLNWGAARIPSGMTSLMVGMAPIFTFLVAALLIGERPTWMKGGGILLAFVGAYVCIRYGSGRDVDLTQLIGALVAMLATFLSSFYTVLGRRLAQKYGALDFTALTFTFGTIPILFTVQPNLLAKLPALPWQFWASDLFLGLGCTGTAHVLWNSGLEQIEATQVSAFLAILPLLGIVWGWLYLGETLTAWLVLGGVMIVAGIAVTNRPKRKPLVPSVEAHAEVP